jgi:hypothetical protein
LIHSHKDAGGNFFSAQKGFDDGGGGGEEEDVYGSCGRPVSPLNHFLCVRVSEIAAETLWRRWNEERKIRVQPEARRESGFQNVRGFA